LVTEITPSLTEWLQQVGKWWWGVIAGAALVSLVNQFHRYWPWIIVAALAIALVGSFLAYHRLRLASRSVIQTRQEVLPPGGGTPRLAPTEYQAKAMRQIVAKLSETTTEFGYSDVNAMLLNYARTGTDPVYEPLHAISAKEGLDRLSALGEITELGNWRWRIIDRNRPDGATSDGGAAVEPVPDVTDVDGATTDGATEEAVPDATTT
jgi:hypothetical protein